MKIQNLLFYFFHNRNIANNTLMVLFEDTSGLAKHIHTFQCIPSVHDMLLTGFLKKCTSLKSLDLHSTYIQLLTLKVFECHFPHLTDVTLRISSYSFDSEYIRQLKIAAPNIDSLHFFFERADFDDDCLNSLIEFFPKLKKLTLVCMQLYNIFLHCTKIARLMEFHDLEYIWIQSMPYLSNHSMQNIMKSNQMLTFLKLDFCPIPLLSFQFAQRLERVFLSNLGISDDVVANLVENTGKQLKELDISCNSLLTDASIEFLEAGCPLLQTLNLTHCDGISKLPRKYLLLTRYKGSKSFVMINEI